MSRTLEQLRQDHCHADRVLDVLAACCESTRLRNTTDYARILDILRYMTDYPDLFHHPREDLMMERLLRRSPGARPLVDEVAREHRELAAQGKRLWECARTALSVPDGAAEATRAQSQRYICAQRAHMNKEEAALFPLAERMLSADDWNALERALGQRPDPLFGPRVAAEYRALYAYIQGFAGSS